MRNADRVRVGGPVAMLAGAIVVTAISVPLATGARAQSTAEQCTETLTEQYGATEFSDVNDRFRNSRRSVYLDAKLKSGKTVRMRCLFEGGGVSQVQAYEEPGVTSFDSWAKWGPADAYRVEEEETAEGGEAESGETEQAAAPTEPGQTAPSEQTGEQPAGQPSEQPSEQPAEQPAGESAEQPAEQPAGESAEQPAEETAEQPTPQFGVRKKAPESTPNLEPAS